MTAGLPDTLAGARVRCDPRPLPAAQVPGALSLTGPDDALRLALPGVGTVCIGPGGADLDVRLAGGVEPALATAWLYGTVAAVVLAAQGRFALHASTSVVGGRAVAVAGDRGAGKSTTVLALRSRGHALVTDDLTPVRLTAGGPLVEPVPRPVHVAPQAAARLGLDVTGAGPVHSGAPKLLLPPPAHPPVLLRQVVVLVTGDAPEVSVERLSGATAALALTRHAARRELVAPRWGSPFMGWAAGLAATVPVHLVSRPRDAWTVDAVLDAVEQLARPA